MRKIGVDKETMTEDLHKIFYQYANISEIFFKPSTSDPKIKSFQEKTTFEIVKNVKGLESKTSLTEMPPIPSLVESKNRGVKRKNENELPIQKDSIGRFIEYCDFKCPPTEIPTKRKYYLCSTIDKIDYENVDPPSSNLFEQEKNVEYFDVQMNSNREPFITIVGPFNSRISVPIENQIMQDESAQTDLHLLTFD